MPIRIFLVFIASFAILLISMNRLIGYYDEGLILTGSVRLLRGDFPHRDFYANYGPGQFYVLSLLFDSFGEKLIVERLYDLFIRASIITICYSILSKYTKPKVALIFTFVCTLYLGTNVTYGYPIYPSLLLILLGSCFLAAGLNGQHANISLFVAGLMTGLTALFRYDLGFIACIAFCMAASTYLFLKDRKLNLKFIANKLTLIITGAALPVLSILMLFWKNNALNGFYHDIIEFSLVYYSKIRSLPFPSLLNLFSISDLKIISLTVYLPIAVVIFSLLSFTNYIKEFRQGKFKKAQ